MLGPHLLWRLAFAALGTWLAHLAFGPDDHAPWLVAGAIVGFQLGRVLAPIIRHVLDTLDPPKSRGSSSSDTFERPSRP